MCQLGELCHIITRLLLASKLKSDGGADNHTRRKWHHHSPVTGSGRSSKAFALVTESCSCLVRTGEQDDRSSQLQSVGQILLSWYMHKGGTGYNFPGGIKNRLCRPPPNALLSSSSLWLLMTHLGKHSRYPRPPWEQGCPGRSSTSLPSGSLSRGLPVRFPEGSG